MPDESPAVSASADTETQPRTPGDADTPPHDLRAATPGAARPPFLTPPATPGQGLGSFAHYEILGVLGEGGMGVVYRARDTRLGREVALKVMRPEVAARGEAAARFLREARCQAALRSPHVVPVQRADECDGVPYLEMPLLPGETLAERLTRGPLSPAEARAVGRQAALGLAAAHAAGLVHRDVKPSNLWLEPGPAGGIGTVLVLDFGLAKAADGDDLSVEGAVSGTPAYMSPEQAQGQPLDARSDLFSLGSVLYEAATGRRPFPGPGLPVMIAQVVGLQPPTPAAVNATLPAALSDLVMRLLAKDPAGRPATAREVADELDRGTDDATTVTDPGPAVGAAAGEGLVAAAGDGARSHRRAPPPGRRSGDGHRPGAGHRRRRAAAAVGLGACVVVALLYALPPRSNPEVAMDVSRYPEPQQPTIAPAVAPPVAAAEPLLVKSLDVKHFARAGKDDLEMGLLGRDSFAPALGDRVQVAARLSRPGYAYLVAFRPDGVADLFSPADEATPPPLTDTPRYPATDGDAAYGLVEGTGLWAFAVVASERPLPAYRDWLAKRRPNWAAGASPTGTVWWYDGANLQTLRPGVPVGVVRGEGEVLTGPASSVRSVGRWLGQSPGTAVGVIGFGVGASN